MTSASKRNGAVDGMLQAEYSSGSSTSREEHGEETNQNDQHNLETASPRTHFYYLSPDAAEQLPKYQYRGQDLSLLYHYILSPLAYFCVNNLTPTWVAPNTITLTGLIFMISSYLAIWYFVPTLEILPEQEPEIPRWIFLWNGIAMLLYQTLDNMDGRQARKTKSSSPLGLLFDHGIDCINSVFGSANWIIAMMLHPVNDVLMCYSLLFGPYLLFFFATWEQFYTGELILPYFNGPSEGLMGGAIMSFISFTYGPSFWQQSTFWDEWIMPNLPTWFSSFSLRHADMLVLFCNVGFVQESLLKTIHVVRTYGIKNTIPNLMPLVVFLTCPLMVGCIDLDVWLSMPRTSLHLFSALFVDMGAELMLAHITEQPYAYARWMLLPLVGMTLCVALGLVRNGRATQDFLLFYASSCIAFLALKFAVVIHECCVVLNIWCFDIVTPRIPTLTSVNTEKKKS